MVPLFLYWDIPFVSVCRVVHMLCDIRASPGHVPSLDVHVPRISFSCRPQQRELVRAHGMAGDGSRTWEPSCVGDEENAIAQGLPVFKSGICYSSERVSQHIRKCLPWKTVYYSLSTRRGPHRAGPGSVGRQGERGKHAQEPLLQFLQEETGEAG